MNGNGDKMGKQKLSYAELSAFCGGMAMLLKAGFCPADGIRVLLRDAGTRNKKGKSDRNRDAEKQDAGNRNSRRRDPERIFEKILEEAERGESLHDAMARTGAFPEYALRVAALGEESGHLEKAMSALCEYYEKEEAIRESVRSAVAYPGVMICMMFLVILALIVKVLPVFQQVFAQLGGEMNGLAAFLLRAGNVLRRYSMYFAAGLGVLAILAIVTAQSDTLKRQLRKILLRLEPIRGYARKAATGRFANAMALAMDSGLDIAESLRMAKSTTGNVEVEHKIDRCARFLTEGADFAQALSMSGIFTGAHAYMAFVGARTGSLHLVMSDIAKRCEDEANRQLQSCIGTVEPALVIVLSLTVGLILLSVILPLMSILSSIG